MSMLFLSLLLIFDKLHVIFKHFQNLENIILNILTRKKKKHIPCLVSFYNSTVKTAMINFWSKFHIQIVSCSFARDNRFLLTPSQSLPGKQKNPFSSACRHINNSFKKFNSELNNGGKKLHFKRPFKNYFLSPKKR